MTGVAGNSLGKASSAGETRKCALEADGLSRVLFVVVSCTRDSSREEPFRRLIHSINEQHARVGFENNLLLFDNASLQMSPMEDWAAPAVFAMCPKNVGYWTALKWALENAPNLFGRTFDFIHPIESDLVLYQLERIREAIRFLDHDCAVDSVRTQEFSVARKRRFFKGKWSLFPCRRSRVADYNGVTGEKVQFSKVVGFERLYTTNWHSKVPALHRYSAFSDVFSTLAKKQSLTELDFMKEMHNRATTVALLDGGIYFTTSFRPKRNELAGSYSDAPTLAAAGYRQTRSDGIDPLVPAPAIEHRL